MCVACRKRDYQDRLIRLQKIDNIVITYQGKGRSFYLCYECIKIDKNLDRVAKRLKVKKDNLIDTIKEYLSNES